MSIVNKSDFKISVVCVNDKYKSDEIVRSLAKQEIIKVLDAYNASSDIDSILGGGVIGRPRLRPGFNFEKIAEGQS